MILNNFIEDSWFLYHGIEDLYEIVFKKTNLITRKFGVVRILTVATWTISFPYH